jgi:type II secretory pathway component PulK
MVAIMNSIYRKTLDLVFAKPTPASLEWARIEALFAAVGAQTIEGDGSRVRFALNNVVGTFHRPHPAKEAKPYQVKDARQLLEQAGVKPGNLP